MRRLRLLIILILPMNLFAQMPSNRTFAYPELIRKYRELDSLTEQARIITYGRTDCGEPLQLFVISSNGVFDPKVLHEMNKCILFINNGIHPGEPDGIDASYRFAFQLVNNPMYKRLIENVVICIVPVFNIDGALQRGCCSRVNQNGPEEYGFRGNAKNLDLNRDFMKTDAKNTRSLINILHNWDPDVFIDTHVSDGADYQYTMTLISSQHNKMNPLLGKFMKEKVTPAIFDKMKGRGDEITPYVNTTEEKSIPDSGIYGFLETPRFLSGYMSVFNTFSFISETHMLKPFDKRVKSNFDLLVSLAEVCSEEGKKIVELRKKAFESDLSKTTYDLNWECDTTKFELIDFKGYAAGYKTSKVTGGQRLFYDRKQPYKKKIRFYDDYYPTDSAKIPKYFYIPQAWENVLKILEINGVSFIRINRDSASTVTATYITSYKTVQKPYEGHYLHYDVKTRTETLKINMTRGDYLIELPQKNMRYIMEALTPQSCDSYFCWGFFDSFLQEKEWFSDYVFEDLAASMLETDTLLKKNFDDWKLQNKDASEFDQLYYVYSHSQYFEKTFQRYPVFSIY